MRAHLGNAEVTLRAGGTAPPRRTSTAEARIGSDGAAVYRFDIAWDPGEFEVEPVRVLHTGSLATLIEPGARAVASALSAADPDILVSFDPNVRPSLGLPRDTVLTRVERIAGLAHLVKMSDEDLDELRERATRMAVDARRDPATGAGAYRRVCEQLGIHPETLRTWVKQAEIDQGYRTGTTTSDAQRLVELKKEVRELRRANSILRSAFLAAELDRPQR